MSDVNVLFLGVGIMPHRIAGDKNFLLELGAYLNRQGIATHFISIAEKPKSNLLQEDQIIFLPRPFHWHGARYYHWSRNGRITGYHHQHTPIREWLELSLTLFLYAPKIRQICNSFSNLIVHWTDFTLLMPLVRQIIGKKAHYVCSALRYIPQNKIGSYLRVHALNKADLIITGTEAAKRCLSRDGCAYPHIVVAPWGFTGLPTGICRSRADRITPGPVRFLWAGFIQQIGKEDFLRTILMARRVAETRHDVEFTFCLKPESFSHDFLKFQRPGIYIKQGDENFLRELSEYDALLSPVLNKDCTLAPPLTWVEALSAGLPLITTRTLGIDELLTNGYSALIFEDYASLEAWLLEERDFFTKLYAMRTNAQNEFMRRYSMEVVGHRYLKIYRRLFD